MNENCNGVVQSCPVGSYFLYPKCLEIAKPGQDCDVKAPYSCGPLAVCNGKCLPFFSVPIAESVEFHTSPSIYKDKSYLCDGWYAGVSNDGEY